jgi:hypothetical protein
VAAVFVVGLVVGDRLAHHPAAPSSTSESAHHPPAHQEAPPLPYKNPVIATDFPDPDVVWTGAEYVAAATGTSTQHIQFATSRNLVQWKTGSDLLPQLPAWAVNGFGNVWAPDLEHAGGSWILWFSAPTRSSGEQCIGWATSRSVSGPFVTSSTAPAVCQIASGGSIDPSVTTDKSGRHYPALEKQRELLRGGVSHLVTAAFRRWQGPDRTTYRPAFVFGRMGDRPDRI